MCPASATRRARPRAAQLWRNAAALFPGEGSVSEAGSDERPPDRVPKPEPRQGADEERLESFYVGRSERNDDPVSVLTTQLSAARCRVGSSSRASAASARPPSCFGCSTNSAGLTTHTRITWTSAARCLERTPPLLCARGCGATGPLVKNSTEGNHPLGGILSGGRTPPPADTPQPALLINAIVEDLRQQFKSHAILLLDGAVYALSQKRLVYRLLTELGRLNCSVVVAVSLTTDVVRDFNPFRDNWEPVHLPAVPPFTQDLKGAYVAGWQLLKSVVERPDEPGTLDPAALRLIIPASGGIHRDRLDRGLRMSRRSPTPEEPRDGGRSRGGRQATPIAAHALHHARGPEWSQRFYEQEGRRPQRDIYRPGGTVAHHRLSQPAGLVVGRASAHLAAPGSLRTQEPPPKF